MSVPRPRWFGRLAPFAVALAVLSGCDFSVGLFGPYEWRPITIKIQGTVTAADDGRPLAGVTVDDYLVLLNEVSATTDSLGRYSLSIPSRCRVTRGGCQTNRLTLVVHLDGFVWGFEPQMRYQEWTVRGHVELLEDTVDFALRPTRPITLTVGGRLTSASSGEPIEDAEVMLEWNSLLLMSYAPRVFGRTDDEGRYLVTLPYFCAISGSFCLTSFRIVAGTENHWGGKLVEDLNVVGDSISLTLDFNDL
jgi:hypothetical protein